MGAILQTAVGIDLIPAALISSVITLAYTWSGGMLAVTMTDAVQYVIIIIGVSLFGYLAIDHLGGFDAMMATLNHAPHESNLKLFSGWGRSSSRASSLLPVRGILRRISSSAMPHQVAKGP